MTLPDSVARVAKLSPEKRVTVIDGGKLYVLPIVPEPAPAEPPNPFVVVADKLLERDCENRAATESLAGAVSRVDAALDAVTNAASLVADGRESSLAIAEAVAGVAEGLRSIGEKIPVISGKAPVNIELVARKAVDARLAETKVQPPITYRFDVERGPDGLITHIIMNPVI